MAMDLTSITTEPIFYGAAQPTVEALTPEQFLHRSEATKLAKALADEEAIRRTVGNFRGEAYTWWKNLLRAPDSEIDKGRAQTNWTYFLALFRTRFFSLKERWDTSQSYLAMRQTKQQTVTEYAQDVLDRYLEDQDLLVADVRTDIDSNVRPADLVPVEAVAWHAALTAEQKGWVRAAQVAYGERVITAFMKAMTQTDVARVVSVNAYDGRMRTALREKLKDRLTVSQLLTFLQQKEDILGKKPIGQTSADRNVQRNKQQRVHALGNNAEEPTDTSNDTTTEDYDDGSEFTEDGAVDAMRGGRGRGRGGKGRFRGRGKGKGRGGPPSSAPAAHNTRDNKRSLSSCPLCNNPGHTAALCSILSDAVQNATQAAMAQHMQAPPTSYGQESGNAFGM